MGKAKGSRALGARASAERLHSTVLSGGVRLGRRGVNAHVLCRYL